MVAIRAHFDGKVFVPEEPVDLQPGTRLVLRVERSDAAGTAAEAARRLAGTAPWKDRTDIADSGDFARQLREDAQSRRDRLCTPST